MVKKIDLKEIFKNNVKFELEDGSKLIGPGPCPLKISDWMTFLSVLWSRYDKGIAQAKTWIYTSILTYFATGTFFLAIFSKGMDDPNRLIVLGFGIYVSVFVGSLLTIKFFERMMDHQGECREAIYLIINSIMHGTLRETNLIRDAYDETAEKLHLKSKQLIKELKLD